MAGRRWMVERADVPLRAALRALPACGTFRIGLIGVRPLSRGTAGGATLYALSVNPLRVAGLSRARRCDSRRARPLRGEDDAEAVRGLGEDPLGGGVDPPSAKPAVGGASFHVGLSGEEVDGLSARHRHGEPYCIHGARHGYANHLFAGQS